MNILMHVHQCMHDILYGRLIESMYINIFMNIRTYICMFMLIYCDIAFVLWIMRRCCFAPHIPILIVHIFLSLHQLVYSLWRYLFHFIFLLLYVFSWLTCVYYFKCLSNVQRNVSLYLFPFSHKYTFVCRIFFSYVSHSKFIMFACGIKNYKGFILILEWWNEFGEFGRWNKVELCIM